MEPDLIGFNSLTQYKKVELNRATSENMGGPHLIIEDDYLTLRLCVMYVRKYCLTKMCCLGYFAYIFILIFGGTFAMVNQKPSLVMECISLGLK